jgi:hypothetical protein
MSIVIDAEKKVLLKEAFEKISGAMVRKQAEQDMIKAVIADLHEETEIDKRILRRMAKTYYTDNFAQEKEQNSEFEQLMECIVV